MNNALYEACLLSQNEWINSFMPLEEHVFSKRHERKMEVLFSRIRNDKYHKLTKNAVRAIIIAAIILSLALTALAIEIAKAYNAYSVTEGTVYNAAIKSNTDETTALSIGYIPNGYELIKEEAISHAVLKQYMSESKNIIVVNKYILSNEAVLNTENNPYEIIYKNNIKYIYYHYKDFDCIIWNNDGYAYFVNGNLSKEELLLVAFSTE